MRIVLVVMFLAVSASAQDQPAFVAAAACGPRRVNFDVKRDETQKMLAQPEPAKARVYFIQDIGVVNCLGSCLTTKIGRSMGRRRPAQFLFLRVRRAG